MAEASFIQFLFGQLRTSDGSLAGGTAYFYTVGTSTPKAIYSDMAMTSAIYSIVLDADGSAEVYGSGQYRCVVKDSDGVTQYDKDVNFLAPSSYVSAPATNTDAYIPQWDGANSGTLKNGLLVVTTVGATGDDTSIPTEQAVREAITGIVSAATTTSSGTVEIATNAEALAGTDASRSISPASLDYVIDNTPHVLQVVNYSSGAVASTSNQIPYDDTIPQNTEGAEWATLAITPKSATSKLVIDVILNIHTSGWHHAVVGLFQDTTANCLACSSFYGMDGGNVPVTLKYFMVSGTTSATTFKVRYGASGGTTTVNGSSGSRNYGGVLTSSITITEVLV